MNEERPIEKLLRRYAKKRRDATPESPGLELHPATRRLLQGEVTRQFSRSDARKKTVAPSWRMLWPRLVWALPVLAVLTFGVWAFIGLDHESAGSFDLAKNEIFSAPAEMAKQSPLSGPQPSQDSLLFEAATAMPAPVAAATPTLAPSESSQAYAGSARAEEPANRTLDSLAQSAERDRNESPGDKAVKLESTSALAPPPQLAATARELGPKADHARANLPEVATATRADTLKTFSTGGGGVAIPSAPPATVNAESFATAQTFKQNFDQSGVNARSATAAKTANIAPVLANFQVEQNGNALRVIDSDGSTYTGSVELAGRDKDSRPADEFKEKAPATQAYARQSPPTGAVASGVNTQAGQSYFFRVAGTNRTLQQSVVFAGNFVALTNPPSPTPRVAGGRAGEAQPARGPMASPVLFNSSINGRAQLGAGLEFEINAMPVPVKP